MEKPKLIVVEDDDLSQIIYENIFSKYFEITVCTNDSKFYDSLKTAHYDIFLIDLGLGKGKNGVQLIEELRLMEEYKTTPIIVVTAYTLRKDEQISMLAGATKFLQKPIDNKVLLNEFKSYF
ncbi:MAG: response regulator [Ignavibacteriales bacterium]|nr:response regulator [Ignavibacteriales bacterium]